MTDDAIALRCADDLNAVQRKMGAVARSFSSRLRATARRRVIRQVPTATSDLFLVEMTPILTEAMVLGHLLGVKRSLLLRNELELGFWSSLVDLINKKTKLDLRAIAKKYKTQAFTILQGASKTIERKLQVTVDEIIKSGVPTRAGTKMLEEKFDALGITPKSSSQVETIVRTQTQLANAAGRWQTDQDPDIQDILWGYRYVTVGDDRVRPEHEALDGTTLPKDDDFWTKFWPPNGWNCRCQAIPIYEKREIVKPQKVDGKIAQPDQGFDFNAGEAFD